MIFEGPYFSIFGILQWNITLLITVTAAVLITFGLSYWLTKDFRVKPVTKKQVIFEIIINFVKGIISSFIHDKNKIKYFIPFILTLFLFLLISNLMGIPLVVQNSEHVRFWQSPTAIIQVTMTLSFMVTILAFYYGSKYNDGKTKGMLATFTENGKFMLPMNILEEVTNFLSLGIRIFGNIMVGEVIIELIGHVAYAGEGIFGIVSFLLAGLVEIAWMAFSIFIGFVQAYVFAMLATLYISKKVEGH